MERREWVSTPNRDRWQEHLERIATRGQSGTTGEKHTCHFSSRRCGRRRTSCRRNFGDKASECRTSRSMSFQPDRVSKRSLVAVERFLVRTRSLQSTKSGGKSNVRGDLAVSNSFRSRWHSKRPGLKVERARVAISIPEKSRLPAAGLQQGSVRVRSHSGTSRGPFLCCRCLSGPSLGGTDEWRTDPR